ncbi:MAG: redox-sensing transcriptional repressor Rex [Christensenellales bacterium]
MRRGLILNPIQVRKDLSQVSVADGRPKLGFKVSELISDMENFLGYNNTKEAVLVGAGLLGKTLLSYNGFSKYALEIVAAFDVNPELVGKTINGKQIFPMSELAHIVRRMNIKMGIITVPRICAQEVCDLLVGAGVRGIWDFAPVHLDVPDYVAIKYEDLATSFLVLSNQLSKKLSEEQGENKNDD